MASPSPPSVAEALASRLERLLEEHCELAEFLAPTLELIKINAGMLDAWGAEALAVALKNLANFGLPGGVTAVVNQLDADEINALIANNAERLAELHAIRVRRAEFIRALEQMLISAMIRALIVAINGALI